MHVPGTFVNVYRNCLTSDTKKQYFYLIDKRNKVKLIRERSILAVRIETLGQLREPIAMLLFFLDQFALHLIIYIIYFLATYNGKKHEKV